MPLSEMLQKRREIRKAIESQVADKIDEAAKSQQLSWCMANYDPECLELCEWGWDRVATGVLNGCHRYIRNYVTFEIWVHSDFIMKFVDKPDFNRVRLSLHRWFYTFDELNLFVEHVQREFERQKSVGINFTTLRSDDDGGTEDD